MAIALITINANADRERAATWSMKAPDGTRITFKGPRRTIPQNDRMWAMLTDIATQVEWHGLKLKPDDWKLIFLDALKREVRIVPNLDGNGFVNLGRSSSELSKEEMAGLIELMFAFGATHEVKFNDAANR